MSAKRVDGSKRKDMAKTRAERPPVLAKKRAVKRRPSSRNEASRTKRRPASLALSPKSALSTGAVSAAAAAVLNPAVAPYVFLFGTMGVALSVGATLAIDAMRPAAKAFGARLAQRIAPDTTKRV